MEWNGMEYLRPCNQRWFCSSVWYPNATAL